MRRPERSPDTQASGIRVVTDMQVDAIISVDDEHMKCTSLLRALNTNPSAVQVRTNIASYYAAHEGEDEGGGETTKKAE